jgi:hypothetical protein
MFVRGLETPLPAPIEKQTNLLFHNLLFQKNVSLSEKKKKKKSTISLEFYSVLIKCSSTICSYSHEKP